MHPAKSVIIFTVLSGAGFGMIFVLGLGYPVSRSMAAPGCLIALVLSVAGLISSTFHLGHPERAWRAVTQWRSSWLSREGVASLLTLALFLIYSGVWVLWRERVVWLGDLCALGAMASVAATAMIYAQLRTVPRWRTAWTPACYLLFSLASGLSVSAAISPAKVVFGAPVAALLVATLIIAWASKIVWWRRAARTTLKSEGHTRKGATGLGSIGAVRLLERPHAGPNYLTKEMVFRIARKHASKLRRIALLLGAGAPLLVAVIVAAASAPSFWLGFAALALVLGLFVERWLFFAEAEHSVSLYY